MIRELVQKIFPNHQVKEHIADRVIQEKLTYLEREALLDLIELVISNDRNNIEGIIIETGCALGGSAIAMADSKKESRELFVYDVFDIIPPPSEKDDRDVHERYKIITSGSSQGIGNNQYYGYEEDLYNKVFQSLIQFGIEPAKDNVHLVKGLFEDTLKISMPVSLAHIDCDWYESVMSCLKQIVPHLTKGGTLVIDDYYAWSGCKKAVDDYFTDKREKYQFLKKRRLHIVKN